MKKSQSISTEFIFGIAIILIIFVILFSFMQEKKPDIEDTEEELGKREECLKLSNLISSVYAGGSGTEATTKIDNMVIITNNSLIYVSEGSTEIILTNSVAAVASEATPTSQEFYDLIADQTPTWYKICFNDIEDEGCDEDEDGVVDWDLINLTFEDLIRTISESPNTYQTIYLEDPYILYNRSYNGKNYTDILGDWVKDKRSLIIAGWLMCDEENGPYKVNETECPPLGVKDDKWNFSWISLTQDDSGNPRNLIEGYILEDLFPTLTTDNIQLKLDSRSYAINISNYPQISDFIRVAHYVNKQPSDGAAISFWNYGEGMVFYFGDSKLDSTESEDDQTLFYEAIKGTIELSYPYLIKRFIQIEKGVMCKSNTPTEEFIFGAGSTITIKNEDNEIVIENG